MNKNHNRPAWGQRVIVHARAYKDHEHRMHSHSLEYWRRWYSSDYSDDMIIQKHGELHTFWNREELDAPREAMYVGFRTVHEGRMIHEVETGDFGTVLGESDYFKRECSLQVWVVVFSEQTNPIYVFPDDVEMFASMEQAV